MAFLGRFQLGQTLPLFLLTKDGSQTPGTPLVPPTAEIWSPAGAKVLSKEMPIIDRYKIDGTFLLPVFLGADYDTGVYRVVYHFTLGSYEGIDVDGFEVMAGGSADGNVISMHFFDRPHARFVVQQLDSGKMVQGRNPTL